ncbi:MAG: DUF4249 family protein [Bacteroidetes bacterium]|nr:DUF4249 family protein [Bacteroidota bacterium]
MKHALLFIPLLLLLASCENEVDAPDWPEHEPKLVVTANLRVERDSVFVFCRVSRTMSLGEEFRVDRAMVNDAVVEIRHDAEVHTIPYRAGYYPYDFDVNYQGFVPRGGSNSYELVVRKDAMTARAVLEVPELPMMFDAVSLLEYDSYWHQGTMYFRLTTPVNRVSYDLHLEALNPNPGLGWQDISYGWGEIVEESYRSITEGTFWFSLPFGRQRIRYMLTARGPEYRSYENSRWWSGYSGSPFESEDQNPPFNVGGDGIGFFWWELVGEPVEIAY